jgi:hypothetical protein
VAHLLDWEKHFGERTLIEHALAHPSSVGDNTPPAPGVSLEVEVAARVSGGMWIADCPTDGCGGAELVNFETPLFFCCECRNALWGHQPLRITVPASQTISDIEAHLTARPVPATRNWLPDETVADLRDENRARGIAPLEGEES